MRLNNYLIYVIIFIIIFSFRSNAQNNGESDRGEITGKLIDTDQFEVIYASVSLLENDGTFKKSAISTATGDFKFIDVAPGTYSLRIDHIEHETFTTESFTLTENEKKVMPVIVLRTSVNKLEEVVITKKKPLIEVKADKLIYNVSSSPSASGTNGLDLLKLSPGVTLDMDNSISILGKGNVQVYINDVQSRLSGNDLTTFLQSLTSDIVDSIEIISNPPAKYDAEGTGGIINIRLKKNVSTGFNGSATSSFTQGLEYKSSNNVTLNFGGEKIKTSLDVTQSQDNNLEFFDDKKIQNGSILYLNSEELQIRKGYNVGFGIEAELNENHSLNLSARGTFNDNDNSLDSTTDIYQEEPLEFLSILSSQSYLDGNSSNYMANLNHLWNAGKATTISTNVSAGTYSTERSTLQPNTYYEPDGTTIIAQDDASFDADTKIDLWSAKVDFDKSWDILSFSTGVKYAHIVTQNGFAFYNIENEIPVFDATKSNDFNYTENVAAIYANANLKIGSYVALNAGLRVENTSSRGKLISDIPLDNKDVPRNYTDYFPNVGLSFENESDHSYSLNIGRRITRPNYQDLNPFESPTSQLVVWKGNPFLKPNYIMNYQASYSYKQKLVVILSYSKTTDFFARIVEIVEGDNTQIIPRNMDKALDYGVSVSFPLTVTKFWELVAFGNISEKTFEGNPEGTAIDIKSTLWNYQIQNNIKLPNDFLLDITFRQQSRWIWRGSVFIEGTESLNFGIRKDLLDKKIQIRITGVDILRTNSDYPYYSNYGGIDLEGTYTDDGRRFGMGATFKFGDSKAKIRKRTKSALDEELERLQN